jgi:hypothetical protein
MPLECLDSLGGADHVYDNLQPVREVLELTQRRVCKISELTTGVRM